MALTPEINPSLEDLYADGAAACEQFVADSRALDSAWSEGKTEDAVAAIRNRVIDDYNGIASAAESVGGN